MWAIAADKLPESLLQPCCAVPRKRPRSSRDGAVWAVSMCGLRTCGPASGGNRGRSDWGSCGCAGRVDRRGCSDEQLAFGVGRRWVAEGVDGGGPALLEC